MTEQNVNMDEIETTEVKVEATETDGLKKKNRELLAANRTLKDQVASLQSKVDDLQASLDETVVQKSGDMDKALASRDARHAKDRDSWSLREKGLLAALEKNLLEAQAAQAIAQADGINKLLMPHVRRRMSVVEQGGQYAVQIIDQDGEPSDMTLADLIAEYKADSDFAGAFRASNVAAGTGSRPSTTVTAEVNPWMPESRNLSKQAAMEKSNPAKAAAFKAAAASVRTTGAAKPALRPVKR